MSTRGSARKDVLLNGEGRPRHVVNDAFQHLASSMRLMRQRQHDGECGSAPSPFACNGDRAVMALDEVPRDGQPQAQATTGRVLERVGALSERVEDIWQDLCGNTPAGVGDRHSHLAVAYGHSHRNAAASRCELQRVRQEVRKDLLKPYRVSENGRTIRGGCDFQMETRSFNLGPHLVHGGVDDRDKRNGL